MEEALRLLLAASAISLVIYTFQYGISRLTHGRKLPLPPGPKGWPILRNLFDLSTDSPWETAAEWSKTYGEERSSA